MRIFIWNHANFNSLKAHFVHISSKLTAAAPAVAAGACVSPQSDSYWICCCRPPWVNVCLWCRERQQGPEFRGGKKERLNKTKFLNKNITTKSKTCEKDDCDNVALAYSVKSVAFNFPPFGAIERGDAQVLICQKMLRNIAVEDLPQS